MIIINTIRLDASSINNKNEIITFFVQSLPLSVDVDEAIPTHLFFVMLIDQYLFPPFHYELKRNLDLVTSEAMLKKIVAILCQIINTKFTNEETDAFIIRLFQQISARLVF